MSEEEAAELLLDLDDVPSHISNIHIRGSYSTDPKIIRAIIQSLPEIYDSRTAAEVLQTTGILTQTFQSYRIFSQCKTMISTKSERVLMPGTSEPFSIAINQTPNLKKEQLVDIYIDLKEKERQMSGKFEFQHRGHNGTRDAGFSLGFTHYNVQGALETLNGQFFCGMKEISFDTTYHKPMFGHKFLSGYTLEAKLFQEDREEQSSFKQRTTKFVGTLLTRTGHSFGYETCFRNVILKKGVDSRIVLDGGVSLKSSFVHKWKWDSRDDLVFPFEGAAINITNELAGLGGDTHFLKQQFDLQYHIPLLNTAFTASVFAKAGTLFPLRNKKSSVCDRFFLGGPIPLRGFKSNTVGPNDNHDLIGGEVFYSQGAHITFPFPFIDPDILQLHVFTNWGSNVALEKRNLTRTAKNLLNTTRVASGLGIVWRSPVGRLEFNYARPLRKQDTDCPKAWDFSISASF